MGTRGITIVILGGEPVVAQYGQWDHYPSGQGITCLEFLQKGILDKLREKLKCCHFVTDDEQKRIEEFCKSIGCENGWMSGEQAKLYDEKFPYFSRNHGSNILNVIADSVDESILLHDQRDFAYDSLFCEYGYVIDLDKNTFEVFEGFSKKPIEKSERFYKPKSKDTEYYPIRLMKSYDLNNLPTAEEFLADLEPKEE
jgi:hypothetical protein